ncbi:MAG: hypothetical protein QQN41_04900, partial [Nitrosopumilus sp.]
IPKRVGDLAKFDNRKFDDPKNKTLKDGKLPTLKDGKLPSLKDGALPPNIADDGTTQIVERNGRIYFGEEIGESACLKSGMSSSEFLTKVIKSKKI